MGMHGTLDDKQTLQTRMTTFLSDPTELKRYINPLNYSRPAELKNRITKNLKENTPLYISFSLSLSGIFCIRNLECLFFVGTWAFYFYLLNKEEAVKIGDYELTSNNALVATFISNVVYLVLFQSVVLKVFLLALSLGSGILVHSAFYEDCELKEVLPV